MGQGEGRGREGRGEGWGRERGGTGKGEKREVEERGGEGEGGEMQGMLTLKRRVLQSTKYKHNTTASHLFMGCQCACRHALSTAETVYRDHL